MSPQPNETPNERTGTADPTDGDRHGPVADRTRATLDAPAGRPSPVGTGISTAVAARVTGRWAGPQFEALLEHVEDRAVFVLDEGGYVRTWNDRAEAVTGHASDDVVGKHLSFLYPDAESGTAERDLRSAAEEGSLTSEGWRVRADGSAFRAETTIEPLREDDELLGFVNVTQDATDDRRERELADRCERLEDLIAAVSHDLRGPLTVAAGNAKLAAETGDTSHLDGVARALDRAEELLDCHTALAEKGERVREATPVELREAAEAAWDVTETGAVELSVEGETVFPADRCRTQQLLENLLKNAVEHGARRVSARDARGDAVERGSTSSRAQSGDSVEHGSTSNRAKPDDGAEGTSAGNQRPPGAGDAVENGTGDGESRSAAGDEVEGTVRAGPLPDRSGFYVEDDGPGIRVEERERVFESGYTTSENGTGFGLAIVRSIAEAHGWSVGVTNGREGGARFEVTTDPNR